MAMDEQKTHAYESPLTVKARVEMDGGVMASSKEKIISSDDNATVDIDRHDEGGSFELDTWNL